MLCAQARRLESQLYQRAQDLRTIEVTQRQAALARAQVRQLEQHHLEQAARISQGAKSLQRLQDLIRESIQSNDAALGRCEVLEHDSNELRAYMQREAPVALANLSLHSDDCASTTALRQRAAALESALAETERSAMQQIGVTPLTSVAMSSDCNPLNDLSAVADYASKASVSAQEAARPRADVSGGQMLMQPATESAAEVQPAATMALNVGMAPCSSMGGEAVPMQMSQGTAALAAGASMSLLGGTLAQGTPMASSSGMAPRTAFCGGYQHAHGMPAAGMVGQMAGAATAATPMAMQSPMGGGMPPSPLGMSGGLGLGSGLAGGTAHAQSMNALNAAAALKSGVQMPMPMQ